MRSQGKLLDAIFAPKTVAIVGATEKFGSVGRTILWNLISSQFGGTVLPVNPHRPNVLGIKAYPRLKDLPDPVDLAVIVTPASTVPDLIGECVEIGAKGAIIISAGFKETGETGVKLESQVLEQARRGRIRIIGPNCLGVMRPVSGLNATFAGAMAKKGNVAFVSQSGALCTAILDWSLKANVGFSAFISIGSMLDVDWGDLIDYLGDDPYTKSIVLYMESIGDAKSFLSAAREVALTKPIIVIKAGRTEAAAKAAASHTGSLAGSDEVLEAAFRRSGVLRVSSISEVFAMTEVLAKQPRPRGNRLTIVTNAGGPGVLATDALIADGGVLSELSSETRNQLDGILPVHWSHANPVDVLGDAGPDRYAKAMDIVAKDAGGDGLLVILTPQAMTDPTRTAEALKPFAQIAGKPVFASWMGGGDVAMGEHILTTSGIPTFEYPDAAARAFSSMWRYSDNLRALYETPTLPPESEDNQVGKSKAATIIRAVADEGRVLLDEVESKQLLVAYGLPSVTTRVALDEIEAVTAAKEIGFPVVLKLYSRTITHKTDVGGVKLNLTDAGEVKAAYRAIVASVKEKVGAEHLLGVTVQPMMRLDGYELIVGSSVDPQFGPVLLFGSGGQLVEVYKDRSLALPPLTSTLARRLMERTKIFKALQGIRGRDPIDLKALEAFLVRFSQLIIEQPRIKELDINPLLASPQGLFALDARVVLHDASITDAQLPQTAIRPYPTQYVEHWVSKDGMPLTIRPIRPEDEPMIVRFHETLSERSVSLRYFHAMKLSARVSHERLTRICFIDYDREMAIVADRKDPWTDSAEILGVCRLSKSRVREEEAEFALLINDQFQGRGLGTELLRRILEIGRHEGIKRVTADILPENREMQRVCEKLGFKFKREIGDPVVAASIDL
jgi:acetyltransferase